MFLAVILNQNVRKCVILKNIVKIAELWGPSLHSFDRLWMGPISTDLHVIILTY